MVFKEYEYVFTEMAEADIDEILSYMAEDLSNPAAAANFVTKLEDTLQEICRNPKIGRPVENSYIRRNDVRRFLVNNFTAYYFVDEENEHIIVLRVVLSRRNQETISKTL
ncbi:type II toxin-antitoxin system RelE/ParE family toxin [[Clostridium] aminophilum]|uniref:type II toxin-antitoxin system RelE/ParE family toxin n=1 Tax=[Clostridium] aminophilum TaxID=1526 RepID=UPI00331E052B